MKYIRTKDGIYEKTLVSICELDGIEYGSDDEMCYAEIIKQADTIEELCDEFVIVWKDKKYNPYTYNQLEWKDFAKEKFLETKSKNDVEIIYGAIWTDKGLIYVAKMNSKGELELL